MSAFTPIIIQTGEQGVVLQFTIKRNGVVINLTGATVKLFVDGLGFKTCTIVDGPAGRADYVVQPGDWPAGYYAAQIEVSYAVGPTNFKSERFDFKVEQAVA